GGDVLALPFELELLLRAPLEEMLDSAMRRVVNEHRARLGRGLQPRRDVHRVAESRVLDSRAGADLPHPDRAGRRPYADTKALGTPAAPHLAGVLLHLADDAERAADAALGVVLSRRGRSEEREHTVSGEILHMAVERLHFADDPRYCL